jgi:hypothetical protein
MYSAGQSKPSKKALQKSPKQPSKDLLAAEKDVEMGVVTELAQEQEISQE